MADYWHKKWACPYFVWDEQQKIGCEGSIVVKFPSRKSICMYAEEYCCRIDGYKDCPIAASIEKKYGGNKKC